MKQADNHNLELLLAEKGWLGRLCLGLVSDRHEADEIAQETLARALASQGLREVPGRMPGAQRVRGWLARTARRIVSERRRNERHRGDREARLEPGGSASSVVEELARAEFRERLARAVTALPEAERIAIVLRYYEDLCAPEIARRLGGVTSTAVRKRLSRGLERLRSGLAQEDFIGEGAEPPWESLALVIASQKVTMGARSAAPMASSVGPLVGAAAALFAVGILLVGWFGPGAFEADPTRVTVPSSSFDGGVNDGPLGLRAQTLTLEGPGRTPHQGPRVAARVKSAADPGLVTLRLVDGTTGQPIAGHPWGVLATGRLDLGRLEGFADPYPNGEFLAEGVTDADGIGRFVRPELDLVNVYTPRSERFARGSWAIRVDRVASYVHELPMSIGCTVTGRVTDRDGAPRSDVTIVGRTFDDRAIVLGETGPEGRFSLPRIADFPRGFVGTEDGRVEPGRVQPTTLWFWPRSEFRGNLELIDLGHRQSIAVGSSSAQSLGSIEVERLRTLAGRVVDFQGRAAAGALVSAQYTKTRNAQRGLFPAFGSGATDGPTQIAEALTDANGRFEIRVFPGQARAGANGAAGLVLALGTDGAMVLAGAPEATQAGKGAEWVLQLGPPTNIRFRLRDAQGFRLRPDGGLLHGGAGAPRARMALDVSRVGGEASSSLAGSSTNSFMGARPKPVEPWLSCAGESATCLVNGSALGWDSSITAGIGGTVRVPGYGPARFRLVEGQTSVEVELSRLPVVRVTPVIEGAAAGNVGSVDIVLSTDPEQLSPLDWGALGRGLNLSPVVSWNSGVGSVDIPLQAAGPVFAYARVTGESWWFDSIDLGPMGPFDVHPSLDAGGVRGSLTLVLHVDELEEKPLDRERGAIDGGTREVMAESSREIRVRAVPWAKSMLAAGPVLRHPDPRADGDLERLDQDGECSLFFTDGAAIPTDIQVHWYGKRRPAQRVPLTEVEPGVFEIGFDPWTELRLSLEQLPSAQVHTAEAIVAQSDAAPESLYPLWYQGPSGDDSAVYSIHVPPGTWRVRPGIGSTFRFPEWTAIIEPGAESEALMERAIVPSIR